MPLSTCVLRCGSHEEKMGTSHASLLCHHHLLYDFLDVLICCLYSPIHLRSVRRRVVVVYLKLLAELSDHLVIDIGTVVCNDSFWDAVSTDRKSVV